MLSLDSPQWADLQHAYGPATEIPSLLTQLRDASDDEALDEAYSCLCHQGSVYTASYAAVPHIAALLPDVEPTYRFNLIGLLGAIASSTDRAPIPAALRQDYAAGLEESARHAKALLDDRQWDQADFIMLLQSVAALDGCTGPDRLLERLVDEEFEATCPNCEKDLLVSVRSTGFFVYATNNQSKPVSGETEVIPRGDEGGVGRAEVDCRDNYSWLRESANRSGHATVAFWLRCMYGTAICPLCFANFDLMPRLEDAR